MVSALKLLRYLSPLAGPEGLAELLESLGNLAHLDAKPATAHQWVTRQWKRGRGRECPSAPWKRMGLMGQMQRRRRIDRELNSRARLRVFLRPRGVQWVSAAQFEADAARANPPLSSKQLAEQIAALGLNVWYDAVADVIRAERAR